MLETCACKFSDVLDFLFVAGDAPILHLLGFDDLHSPPCQFVPSIDPWARRGCWPVAANFSVPVIKHNSRESSYGINV
jgi:hypothetical protein